MYVYLYISGCVHDLRQNHQLYSVACNLKKKKHYLWKHCSWPKMLWPVRQSPRKALLQEEQVAGVRGEGWGCALWNLRALHLPKWFRGSAASTAWGNSDIKCYLWKNQEKHPSLQDQRIHQKKTPIPFPKSPTHLFFSISLWVDLKEGTIRKE